MKLGDTITVAGVEWTVRPFTAAEHQRFDELADAHDLHRKAAQLATAQGLRAGGMREQLIQGQVRQIEKRLAASLDEAGALRENLADEDQLEAFELAAKLDTLAAKLDDIKAEPMADLMLLEDELLGARDAVAVEFMAEIIGITTPIVELIATVSPEELVQLQEVIGLGKLRAGLSAYTRQQQALWERVLKQRLNEPPPGTGNDSTSPPSPPAAPAKPGRRGRSKTPSGTSKAGG